MSTGRGGGAACEGVSQIFRGQPPPRLTIRDMQDVAAARGGACLSEFYVNAVAGDGWAVGSASTVTVVLADDH